jgi:Ser/Thr protein kinase RdoA (MazF antagonist)
MPVFSREILEEMEELLTRQKLADRGSKLQLLYQKNEHDARLLLTEDSRTRLIRFYKNTDAGSLAKEIDNYLHSEGLNVLPTLDSGLDFPYRGTDYKLDLRAYKTGRPYDGSIADFEQVLKTLHPVHSALRNFPRRSDVQRMAEDFAQRLERTRNLIVSKEPNAFAAETMEWLEAHQDFVQDALTDFDVFLAFKRDPQVIHADLHPGNVVFDNHGTAFLFDFEKSHRFYLHFSYDLYYLVERFCRIDSGNLREVSRRIQLINSYYQSGLSGRDMVDGLQQISLGLILMVFDRARLTGMPANLKELDKFALNFKNAELFMQTAADE